MNVNVSYWIKIVLLNCLRINTRKQCDELKRHFRMILNSMRNIITNNCGNVTRKERTRKRLIVSLNDSPPRLNHHYQLMNIDNLHFSSMLFNIHHKKVLQSSFSSLYLFYFLNINHWNTHVHQRILSMRNKWS